MGIGEYLGHPRAPETAVQQVLPDAVHVARTTAAPPRAGSDEVVAEREPVTLVIPCFNEDPILPYLANTLKSVEAFLAPRYELRLIFVDDGSSDGTWTALQELWGDRRDTTLLRHAENLGVAKAILTGIRRAETEIVCSIDCDCTYDPHQLETLIPMLEEGIDMVTASPYHREGEVRNVPSWRIALSKRLSGLYRLVLRQRLATYTSCFRVYRRSAMVDLELREAGFLGVAEMLGLLDLDGRRIVECPAVLEVRLLGHSKMRVLKTGVGHLRLLARLFARRLGQRWNPAEAPRSESVVDRVSDHR
jgi:glycosyltransferase involved in cell wall biosynthesis